MLHCRRADRSLQNWLDAGYPSVSASAYERQRWTLTAVEQGLVSDFDFEDRFRGLSKADLNALIELHQRELLRRFFGSGPRGAMRRGQDFVVPGGLSESTLACYHEIARRYIAAGQDRTGVQFMRLWLVERALKVLAEP